MVKLFLSSTYLDLKEFRQAAIDAMERVAEVVAMEKFFASDHRPKDEALAMLRDCDAMVLIIGSRYGSVDGDTRMSVTELEYRNAIASKIPVLPFLVVDETGKWKISEPDEARAASLKRFRQDVGGDGTWQRVRTPGELQLEIILAKDEYEQRNGVLGARIRAFQEAEDFFRNFDNGSSVFNHSYALIGRTEIVKEIADFSTSFDASEHILILPGRGGLGKSRLLKEVANRVKLESNTPRVLFLRDTGSFPKDTARELPVGQLVIVVDDAHRMNDLGALIHVASEYQDRVKLILVTRPEGLPIICRTVLECRINSEQLRVLPELTPLSSSEILELARVVLGNELQHHAERVVAIAGDSPLVTVVAANLLRHKEVDPEAMVTSDITSREIFGRFVNVLVGEVSSDISPAIAKKILVLVAALSPLSTRLPDLLVIAADYVGVSVSQLRNNLDTLKCSGALVETVSGYQITPDLLSDHILLKEAVADSGTSTGFVELLFKEFGDLALDNILTNTLDIEPHLVLDIIESVANDGPIEVQHPSLRQILEGVPANPRGHLSRYLSALIERDIVVQRSFDLLWLLGRDDPRGLDQTPEHPIRVLRQSLELFPDQQESLVLLLLDCAEQWLGDQYAFEHTYSPLDVLSAAMKKEVEFIRNGVSWRANVSVETWGEIRRRTARLLVRGSLVRSPPARQQLLVVLLNAIWSPIELIQERVTEPSAHLIENQGNLACIQEILNADKSPVLSVLTEQKLNSIVRRGGSSEMLAPLTQTLQQMSQSDERLLFKNLMYGRYQMDFLATEISWQEVGSIVNTEADKLILSISEERSSAELKLMLETAVDEIEQFGVDKKPEYFIGRMGFHSPETTSELAYSILNDSDSNLRPYVGALVEALADINSEEFDTFVAIALDQEDLRVVRSVADVLSKVDLDTSTRQEFISQLATQSDSGVLWSVIQALKQFPTGSRENVIRIASLVDLRDQQIVNEYCELLLFSKHRELVSDLGGALRSKLVEIPSLEHEGYAIFEVFNRLLVDDPSESLTILLARIDKQTQASGENDTNYRAIPSPYSDRFDVREIESATRLAMLRRITDTMLVPGSRNTWYELSGLFAVLSNGYDQVTQTEILRLVESEGLSGVRIAKMLLHWIDQDYVYLSLGFLDRLLRISSAFENPEERTVTDTLVSRTVVGSGSARFGEPRDDLITIEERSTNLAKEHGENDVLRRFFEELAKGARQTNKTILSLDHDDPSSD